MQYSCRGLRSGPGDMYVFPSKKAVFPGNFPVSSVQGPLFPVRVGKSIPICASESARILRIYQLRPCTHTSLFRYSVSSTSVSSARVLIIISSSWWWWEVSSSHSLQFAVARPQTRKEDGPTRSRTVTDCKIIKHCNLHRSTSSRLKLVCSWHVTGGAVMCKSSAAPPVPASSPAVTRCRLWSSSLPQSVDSGAPPRGVRMRCSSRLLWSQLCELL